MVSLNSSWARVAVVVWPAERMQAAARSRQRTSDCSVAFRQPSKFAGKLQFRPGKQQGQCSGPAQVSSFYIDVRKGDYRFSWNAAAKGLGRNELGEQERPVQLLASFFVIASGENAIVLHLAISIHVSLEDDGRVQRRQRVRIGRRLQTLRSIKAGENVIRTGLGLRRNKGPKKPTEKENRRDQADHGREHECAARIFEAHTPRFQTRAQAAGAFMGKCELNPERKIGWLFRLGERRQQRLRHLE